MELPRAFAKAAEKTLMLPAASWQIKDKMRRIILGAFCLVLNGSFAQLPNKENYDIGRATSAKDCSKFIQLTNTKPKDVRFSTKIVGDSVYLLNNDISWSEKFFSAKKDGVAIDLVSKDQYSCANPLPKSSEWSHRGFLLPPVYRDQMIKNSRVLPNGYVISYMGKIPEGFSSQLLEANYLILENKNRCGYSGVSTLISIHGRCSRQGSIMILLPRRK